MASGTISLGSSNQIQGQICWRSTSNGASANSSRVVAEIQVKRINQYTTTGHWTGALNIGGTTKSFSTSASVTNEWVILYIFAATIPHSADGSGTCYISGDIRGPSQTTQADARVYANATVTLDKIPRYATAVSATDFTDEENPVLVFSNPAGSSITSLQAAISSNGADDDIANYRDITKTATSYTFSLKDTERAELRKSVTGGTSRTIRLYVRSKIGSSDSWHLSYVTCKVTVIDCNPSVSLSVVDTNDATIALTGNSQILVRYMSHAEVTVTPSLKKNATLKRVQIANGGKSDSENPATFEYVHNQNFFGYIVDSRGMTTSIVKNLGDQGKWIPYEKPSCSIGNNQPIVDGTSATYALTITGKCFNGSFGATNNTLTVQYRYKPSGGSFSSWTTISDPTWDASTHRYTAIADITGLDYETTYVFEVEMYDKLEKRTYVKNIKASPVFDWSKEDFNLNVKLNMHGETVLRMNAEGAYGGNVVLSAPEIADDGVFIRPCGSNSSEAQTIFYNDGRVDLPGPVYVSGIGRPVGQNVELWSTTGYQMTSGHTISLKYPVSSTVNGIVLVFSQYNSTNGSGEDANFHSFFVPKSAATGGYSHTFQMTTANFEKVCAKVLYLEDTQIRGNDLNNQSGTGSSGVKYNNTTFVLRKVIAV